MNYSFLGAHQPKAIEMARDLPGIALFMGVGLGKTFTSIRIACDYMNSQKRLMRVLVFTKPLVCPQFEEEWFKFSSIKQKDVTTLQDSQKERVKAFVAKTNPSSASGHVFITNTEALLMEDLFELFKLWKPDIIIYDECHDLKNPSAKRSDKAFDLANPYDKKQKIWLPKPKTLILSGSPVLSSVEDIFHQVKVMWGGWPLLQDWVKSELQQAKQQKCEPVIDPLLNPFLPVKVENFYHWRGRYFRDRNAGMPKDKYYPDWQPMTLERDGFDSIGELGYTLSRISVYATKYSVPELKLPDEIDKTIHCRMTEKQQRVYDEMKKDFISYVSDKQACVASLAITKSLRLMQIVSGFVSTEGRGDEDDVADIRFEGTEKDEKLRQLLKTVCPEEKVLTWAVWRENYANIAEIFKDLGLQYVELHGGVSDKRKLEGVRLFKNDPQYRGSIGHPGSGGVGLNLTVGTQDVFYSRNYSTLHFVQARGRNHRAGQTKRVIHNNLTCSGTIDDTVLVQLSSNLAMAEDLLNPEKRNLSYKSIATGMGLG